MTYKKNKKEKGLSEETLQAVTALGEVLYRVASRLIAEGKAKVVNGKIIFLK